MSILESTASYERWLAQQIPIVAADLELKHEQMRKSAFGFLRGTYYRWVELFPKLLPDLALAPQLVAVGDLHLENFGTWRDQEGDLVWGVNDFDEAALLPYASDLVRLAASAVFAAREERLALSSKRMCRLVLDGYREGLSSGGRPFVVAHGRYRWLGTLATGAAPAVRGWWRKLEKLPVASEPLPPEPAQLLEELAPAAGWEHVLRRRQAGMGSLGHRRLVALGTFQGRPLARELKQLCPAAGVWLGSAADDPVDAPGGPGRALDPLLRRRGSWLGRRLAPDCIKLDLGDYSKRDEERLLHAMGFETANVHLGAASAELAAVGDHVADLSPRALEQAAATMVEALAEDWKVWARSS